MNIKSKIESLLFISAKPMAVKQLAGLIKKHQKPLVGFTFQNHGDLFIRKLLHHDVPVFPSPERAARAMAVLVRYSHLLDKIQSQNREPLND